MMMTGSSQTWLGLSPLSEGGERPFRVSAFTYRLSIIANRSRFRRGELRRLRSQVVCGDRGSRNPYHNPQRPRPRGRRRHRRLHSGPVNSGEKRPSPRIATLHCAIVCRVRESGRVVKTLIQEGLT